MPATAGLAACLERWQQPGLNADLLLLLAATQTAEQDGISAAGATAASRRLTALADAELLLRGTEASRRWALPPLPAGVSPALLSRVAVESLHLKPQVVALGLHHSPDFPHLRLESVSQGPSACLSGGQAMSPDRVETLWNQGERLGRRLRRPLVLAECVPGGTTTALAVLTALGLQAGDLVSGRRSSSSWWRPDCNGPSCRTILQPALCWLPSVILFRRWRQVCCAVLPRRISPFFSAAEVRWLLC